MVSRRSIPAHAGEPPGADCAAWAAGVYPRPRGGTRRTGGGLTRRPGLSPPTRGNPAVRYSYGAALRSIPAHAGEPNHRLHRHNQAEVYPRPRGGTLTASIAEVVDEGLSPPTRGNRQSVENEPRRRGSIPAHAGEPILAKASSKDAKVYPRPRGGTFRRPVPACAARGLSPPTRGNLHGAVRLRAAKRSIPAHAGEPWRKA